MTPTDGQIETSEALAAATAGAAPSSKHQQADDDSTGKDSAQTADNEVAVTGMNDSTQHNMFSFDDESNTDKSNGNEERDEQKEEQQEHEQEAKKPRRMDTSGLCASTNASFSQRLLSPTALSPIHTPLNGSLFKTVRLHLQCQAVMFETLFTHARTHTHTHTHEHKHKHKHTYVHAHTHHMFVLSELHVCKRC